MVCMAQEACSKHLDPCQIYLQTPVVLQCLLPMTQVGFALNTAESTAKDSALGEQLGHV